MEIQGINELIKKQEVCYKEISQIFTNIKKDSASRKTLDYITKRRARLTEFYTEASSIHAQLENLELLSNHTYITTDYFGTLKSLYTEAMEYLDKCESKLHTQHQLYAPTALEPRHTSVAGSAKVKLQIYRIEHIKRNLQKVTQSLGQDKPISHFTTLLETLQRQWQKVEETHFDLFEEETSSSHCYFEDNVFDTIRAEYDHIIDLLCDKVQSSDYKQQSKQASTVKIPKITLPTFNGSYDSWNSFYDLFLTIIHRNESLSETEKMQYLKTHLRGDAAKLIKHLTVCDANYASAWTLLIKRYKNERQIVTKHIDNILNIPQIKKGDAVNLRHLYDTVNENLEGLKNHNIDISAWDTILLRIVSRIWDSETDEKYENQLDEPTYVQSFVDMMGFLEKRVKCLESNIYFRKEIHKHNQEKTVVSKNTTCWLCQQQHTIYNCAMFISLPVQQRYLETINKRVCRKCLLHDSSTQCYRVNACKQCGSKSHHTLLHNDAYKNPKKSSSREPENNNSVMKASTSKVASKTMSSSLATSINAHVTTLLATALVQTKANDGTPQILRVLCDQGSEASFCTEEVAQLLSHPRSKIQTEITGIADEKPKTSNYCIDVQIKPRFPSEFKLPVKLIILPKLTGSLPKRTIPQICSDYLENILLADPTYYKQGPIDIILGAQEFSSLLMGGLRKMQDGMIAQETELGWILSGICSDSTMTNNHKKIVSMVTRTAEIQQLTKFWELEEVSENHSLSNDDQLCETFYNKTTVRNSDGTYTVRLPFKNSDQEYGNTRQLAVARLIQLERKFAKNKNLQNQYQNFLSEYLKMGHMRKVPRKYYGQGKYYIPHQPVIKEESLTTKLRVVFDASCKTSACNNLNSNMYTGPRLQQYLSSILLRWRKHQIVFMADIEKMYRFIKIDERDMTYQRILWRESPKLSIDEYELTTVTYGTASAPYLAIKTLQQLAIDEQINFPRASQVALRDFYVDDVLSGESNLENAKILQKELVQMLQAGGFNLRKWSTNNAQLLQNISNDDKLLKIPLDETRKSLGVLWSPLEDKFSFTIDVNITQKVTKRIILSEVSKIYDPLGWLAPVIINMKLIIQELWSGGANWDEIVDNCMMKRWIEIQSELKTLQEISIPRWCHFSPDAQIEFHGFCDASEKAYGAVIYCRVKSHDEVYNITLLQAKSKVAPKKHKTTLPKLELCAALLLSKLLDKVTKTLEIPIPNIYCWTDSMITLGWIKGEADRWKTFVANRVSEIQQLLPQAHWNYVNTAHNPADIITRGIAPSKLKYFTLWWNGPEWLNNNVLPVTKTIPEICEEVKRSFHVTLTPKNNTIWDRFSSFNKMVRILSYCYRATRHTNRVMGKTSNTSKWFLYFLIMLQILSGVQSTTTYSLKQLVPGFYVKQLGTASVDRGMFRIEISFDKERLQQERVKIKSTTASFSQLFQNAGVIMTETHCNQLLYHLMEQESNFERIGEYLSEVNQIRKKRGLLGQFLTSIFGVNDEVYKDIDTLNENQQHLIEAANHQTKFMLTTISQVNNTEERIRLKLDSFQSKLNQVIDHINNYNHWYMTVDHNNIKIQIMETYQLANAYITEITNHYNGLLEIYLAKATIYSILPPKNVSEILTAANKKIPYTLKIVQQQLLDTRVQENTTHVQVHAYFPIQDISKYMLIHVTAIPKKNNNSSFQIIEVPRAYIALDYNNELYFELSDDEFRSCLKKNRRFLCFPGAVKNMQSNENCIVDQLFKNQTSTKCPAISFPMTNNIVWKQLCMQNTWLYIVKNSTIVSIICDVQREKVVIHDIGVIKISDNCIIKSTKNILAAQRSVSVTIMSSYSKQIDFSVNTFVAQNSKSSQIVKEEVLDSSRDFFQHLTNKENLVKTELDNTIWHQISSHTYVISFSVSIIFLIIVLILLCYGPKVVQCIRTGATKGIKQRPTPSRKEPIYSQPVQRRQSRKEASSRPTAATSQDTELYEMEPIPERCQNVHT